MTLHPEQIKIYRSLSPTEKLNIAESIYRSIWKLKAAATQNKHPQWNEEKVNIEVSKIFLHARS